MSYSSRTAAQSGPPLTSSWPEAEGASICWAEVVQKVFGIVMVPHLSTHVILVLQSAESLGMEPFNFPSGFSSAAAHPSRLWVRAACGSGYVFRSFSLLLSANRLP